MTLEYLKIDFLQNLVMVPPPLIGFSHIVTSKIMKLHA